MSKAKPWPTAANRHRTHSVMRAGEIRKRTETIVGALTEEGMLMATPAGLVSQLRAAINECNIPLALAILSGVEGHTLAIHEQAKQIIDILESAPSENGSKADG